MGVDMTDFKLSFLGQRKRGGGGSTTPLNDIAAEVRDLDEAAQRAGRRINQSARKLRANHKWHPDSDSDALADLAESLVTRADGIRAECEQLSTLLERAKRMVDTAAPAPGANHPGPAKKPAAPARPSSPGAAIPLEADWDATRGALEGVPEELATALLQESLEDPPEGSVWEGPVANGRSGGRPPASEGIRLIATQMAIAGSTRAEIQDHLRERFGVNDAKPVLDEIFGDSKDAA
jgi:hypothetical protein